MQKFLRALIVAGLLLSITACESKETSRAGITGVPSDPATGTVESISTPEFSTTEIASSAESVDTETTSSTEPVDTEVTSSIEPSSAVEWTSPETKYAFPDEYNTPDAKDIVINFRKYKASELKTYKIGDVGTIKVPKSFKLISEDKGIDIPGLLFETDIENIRVYIAACSDLDAQYIYSPEIMIGDKFKTKTVTGFNLNPYMPSVNMLALFPDLVTKADNCDITCGVIASDSKYDDNSVETYRDEYYGAYAGTCTSRYYQEGKTRSAVTLLVYNNSPTFTSDVCYTDLVPIAAALINEVVFS